jgi:hypothetical protein
MKTEHGYEIIASYRIEPNRHIVLVEREHSISPYVIWTMTSDGKCSSGSYMADKKSALARFDSVVKSFREGQQ